MPRMTFHVFLVGLLTTALFAQTAGHAADPQAQRLHEPIYRVAKNIDQDAVKEEQPSHPLDPALRIAYDGLQYIRENVKDCTMLVVKRERVDGELKEPAYLFTKVRERKTENGKVVVPLSVYTKFLRPRDKRGTEAIWVEGWHEGKLVAHAPRSNLIKGKFTVFLHPDGKMAMGESKYPIYTAGLENMVLQMIEIAEKDRAYGECKVNFYKNAAINDRSCTLIEVIHPQKRPHFTFNIARIYMDDELRVPVRYACWGWPETPTGNPVLLEEYTYLNVKLNVGLTDKDFDHNNPEYDYP